MESECSIEVVENYLSIKATGSYDEQLFFSLPRLIKEASDQHKKSLVLVDGSELKGIHASTMSRYELALEIVDTFKGEIKIAVLWPIENTTYYTQAIAEMHGLKFKIFHVKQEALNWLLNE